nr:hypothetical protein CFP56_69846 [Quercus suber]
MHGFAIVVDDMQITGTSMGTGTAHFSLLFFAASARFLTGSLLRDVATAGTTSGEIQTNANDSTIRKIREIAPAPR